MLMYIINHNNNLYYLLIILINNYPIIIHISHNFNKIKQPLLSTIEFNSQIFNHSSLVINQIFNPTNYKISKSYS